MKSCKPSTIDAGELVNDSVDVCVEFSLPYDVSKNDVLVEVFEEQNPQHAYKFDNEEFGWRRSRMENYQIIDLYLRPSFHLRGYISLCICSKNYPKERKVFLKEKGVFFMKEELKRREFLQFSDNSIRLFNGMAAEYFRSSEIANEFNRNYFKKIIPTLDENERETVVVPEEETEGEGEEDGDEEERLTVVEERGISTEQLEKKPDFEILVIGSTSSGKTSLMNGLIEVPGLNPTSEEPCSICPCEITYGPSKMIFYFTDSEQPYVRSFADEEESVVGNIFWSIRTLRTECMKLEKEKMVQTRNQKRRILLDELKLRVGRLFSGIVSELEENEMKKKISPPNMEYRDDDIVDVIMARGFPIRCEIQLPCEKLHYLRLIDIQGLGENDMMDEQVFYYADQADFIVYMVDLTKHALAMGMVRLTEELELLKRRVVGVSEKLMICGSKLDLVGIERYRGNSSRFVRDEKRKCIQNMNATVKMVFENVEVHGLCLREFGGNVTSEEEDPQGILAEYYARNWEVFVSSLEARIFKLVERNCKMSISLIHAIYKNEVISKPASRKNLLKQQEEKERREIQRKNINSGYGKMLYNFFGAAVSYIPYLTKVNNDQILPNTIPEGSEVFFRKIDKRINDSVVYFKQGIPGIIAQVRGFLEERIGLQDSDVSDVIVDTPFSDSNLAEKENLALTESRFREHFEGIMKMRIFAALTELSPLSLFLSEVNHLILKSFESTCSRDDDYLFRRYIHKNPILCQLMKSSTASSASQDDHVTNVVSVVARNHSIINGKEKHQRIQFNMWDMGILLALFAAAGALIRRMRKNKYKFRKDNVSGAVIAGIALIYEVRKAYKVFKEERSRRRNEYVDKFNAARWRRDYFNNNKSRLLDEYCASLSSIMENKFLEFGKVMKSLFRNDVVLLKEEIKNIEKKAVLVQERLFRVFSHLYTWDEKMMIGKGSFGAVYEVDLRCVCRHEPNVRKAAMKITDISEVVSSSNDGHEEMLKSVNIVREAHMLLSLDHENITRGIVIVSREGKLYMFQELAKCSLERLIVDDPRKFPFKARLKCATDIAEAFAYLEKDGILYRDVKPDNILVFQDDQTGKLTFKLGDFTFAKPVSVSLASAEPGNKGFRDEVIQLWSSSNFAKKFGGYGTEVDLNSFGKLLYCLWECLPCPIMKAKDGTLVRITDDDFLRMQSLKESYPDIVGLEKHDSVEGKYLSLVKACVEKNIEFVDVKWKLLEIRKLAFEE